ncbi:MAG: hypothetical protein IJ702_05665 [Fretibacterium sp.]|nr:hypothetical protein [Fretibacterium sp.]
MKRQTHCRALAFAFVLLFVLCSPVLALSNSADAFMSLPFGHTFKRTQLRMERSGAKVVTPREVTLSMAGYFEGYPAVFNFSFHKKKGLKSKSVSLQSSGNAKKDKALYELLMRGYNQQFGSGHETAVPNTWASGRIMMRNIWTPDRYTTITLTYNPEATKRLDATPKNRPIHLLYKYSKWD